MQERMRKMNVGRDFNSPLNGSTPNLFFEDEYANALKYDIGKEEQWNKGDVRGGSACT